MDMPVIDPGEQRVLIVAPLGKDAVLLARALARGALQCVVCDDMLRLLEEIRRGAGVILLAEEALQLGVEPLVEWVAEQPAWSDPPVLLLTGAGASSPIVGDALRRLGNVALIERPVRVAALLSSVHTAVRARLRQYQTRDHLEERDAAHRRKDQFLATLAHELRNPLAPISNCVALLRRQPPGSDLAPLCDILERQATQLIRLVDDLMDVSRITRGKIALRREPTDLAQVMATAIETVRPQIDAAGHRLEVRYPERPALVDGDGVRLCQVLSNLLSNAAKYTDPGGCIRLEASCGNDEVLVAVSDDGIGIAPDSLESVFDLFAQVDAYDMRARGGLGLGLTLSRSLVEMHGGTVVARSAGLGKGSRFEVRLPLLPLDAVQAGAPEPARTPGIEGQRILVVDDNHDAADSLAGLLGALGAQVRVAYDGLDALQLAAEFRPQVAILDLGMPGMSGYDVARRLRSRDAEAAPRLIALSGWGQPQDRRDSRAAGFEHHLIKPVELHEIQALVSSAPVPPVAGPWGEGQGASNLGSPA